MGLYLPVPSGRSPGCWPLRGCFQGALLSLVILTSPGLQSQQMRTFQIPIVDLGENTLEVREFAQRLTLDQFRVFYGFQFSDQRVASGIDFRHRVTGDSAKTYKQNHYDHGNGLAAADVNGDGLIDLYFANQIGGNELWRNRGGGKFENVTETAGVALTDRVSASASFADIDNDGDPDLFVTTVKMGNVLFENDGQGHFTDISEAAGVDHEGHSSAALFFDYDNDGLLDLFVTNVGVYTNDQKGEGNYYIGLSDGFSGHLMPERTERSILYRNSGDGKFRDVTEESGLHDDGWSGDASFVDFDQDGDQDLYVLNMQGDDHYWENLGDGRFEDKTAKYFPKTPWGTMGIDFFDYNNDGLQDLILTDMHSDMSRDVTPGYEKLKSLITWTDDHLQGAANNIIGNAFYRNLGGLRFEEISDSVGSENYWPWGLSVGDLNADGWEDVFIASSMNYPYRYGVNTVLLNNQGQKFLDSEFILGVEPRKGPLRVPWFELDCQGGDRGHHLCSGGPGGSFEILGNLGSRTSVIFDLDNDGDLDIVTGDFNYYPQVLISNLAQSRPVHFLTVKLSGRQSNRDGLGATVKVTAGSRTFTKVHDGNSGYLTHSSLPLYFGLGDVGTADRIEVIWPSGRTQSIKRGIPTNDLLVIEEK